MEPTKKDAPAPMQQKLAAPQTDEKNAEEMKKEEIAAEDTVQAEVKEAVKKDSPAVVVNPSPKNEEQAAAAEETKVEEK